SIYNEQGDHVKTILKNVFRTAGAHFQNWNGKAEDGSLVADGKYKFVVEARDARDSVIGRAEKEQIAARVPVVSDINRTPEPFNPGKVTLDKEAPKINDFILTADTLNIGRSTMGFRFNLSEKAKVSLRVRDKNGKLVFNLPVGQAGRTGANNITWNGKGSNGKHVPPGNYTVSVSAVDNYGKVSKEQIKTFKVIASSSPKQVYRGQKLSIPNSFYRKSVPALLYTRVEAEMDSTPIISFTLYPDQFKIGSSKLNINYNLSDSARVSINVVDSSGKTVKTLLSSVLKKPGFNHTSWDGKDENSMYISEGLYSVVITTVDNFNKLSGNQEIPFKAGYQTVISNAAVTPDPFNPYTAANNRAILSYNLSNDARVTLEVLSSNFPVRTLLNAEWQRSGPNNVLWDGKDDSEKLLGDGNYFIRITARSPITSVFESVYKYGITIEKEAPAITDLSLSPTPFRRYKAKLLSIRYNLSENSQVSIGIYKDNSLVRHIALTQAKKAGYNAAFWDGKDDSGNFVASGVYTVIAKTIDSFGKTGETKKEIAYFLDFTVISADPSENSSRVPVNAKIVLNFSDYIRKGANFADISLQVENRNIPYRTELSSDTLTITPSDKLANSTFYTLTLPEGAVKDYSGRASDGFALNFTTEAVARDDTPAEVNLSKAATSVFSKANKHTITTVTLDETEALAILKKYKNIETAVIPVTVFSDLVTTQLSSGLITALAQKNSLIEVRTPKGSFILPAAEFKPEALAPLLDGDVTNLKLNIKVAVPDAKSINLMQNQARKNKISILGSPIAFQVEAVIGNKTIAIRSFERYVSYVMELPKTAKVKNVGGIALNEDGNLLPVPTKLRVEKVKNTAVLRSRYTGAYAVIEGNRTFQDIKNHWAGGDIYTLASKLVIYGKDRNLFAPNAKVTRAEFATMMVRALGLKPRVQTLAFRDTQGRTWYTGSVGAAVDAALLRGYADGRFKPHAYITRQEVAVVIVQALRIAGVGTEISDAGTEQILARFADRARFEPWATTDIAVVVQNELIKGDAKGVFGPVKTLTRGEIAVIINRMLVRAGLG
ncbi:MAG: FlgD immunoglobulin-like domain containing protein, partial [Carboxydocellales bacterium]